nr:tetratricopeptide repeat protein [Propionibacterium sp.]
MTPGFHDSRAMDLSGLAAAAKAPPGASYVTEADDRTIEAVLAKSMQHPLVIEFYSPRGAAQQLSADLAALANEAAGRYLLVRVNIDASPGLRQALQIQAVPLVVGALGGQLVPLFQGTRDRADVAAAIDQLLQAAAANGVVGRAQPVAAGAPDAGAPAAGPDPRYAAADAAMEAGDFARAVEEFDKILAVSPGDADAKAGRAGAQLLVRLGEQDPEVVIARVRAHPDDVDAQLAAADLEVAGGAVEAAFARLVELVRATSGAEREKVRVRLLDLFETVGPADPAVLKARRDLTSALF